MSSVDDVCTSRQCAATGLVCSNTISRYLPSAGHQGIVRADLRDAARFDHDDPVGVRDRAESMRDDEAGAMAREHSQAGLNQAFAFRVQVAGGFVQDQDSRIGQHGPGDGQSLSLSAAELHASFADDGVVTLGKIGDELVGVGRLRRLNDVLVGGVFAAVGDIRGDRAIKQKHVLLDDSQHAAKALDVQFPQVLAVQQHPPAGRIVEAGRHVAERRLARAAGTDQGDGLSGAHVQRDVLERKGFAARVLEADIFKRDAPCDFVAMDRHRVRTTPFRVAPPADRGCGRARTGCSGTERRWRPARPAAPAASAGRPEHHQIAHGQVPCSTRYPP